MLSLFPELLFLSPLATTLIRVAAGIVYLLVAYQIFRAIPNWKNQRLFIIGNPPSWLILVGAAVTAAIGALLFVGMWTQGVAIIASIGALKMAIMRKWYGHLAPLSTMSALLLFVMSLSLILSGGGAFAIDWPL